VQSSGSHATTCQGWRTVEVVVLQHGLAVEQRGGVRLELVLHQRAPGVVEEVNVAVPARRGP